MDDDKINDSINIIVDKSKELLEYQINCYDTYFNKAGIFISISSLFTPVSFSLLHFFTDNNWWIIAFFIPIALNLKGLYFLVQVVRPKKLSFGIGHHVFEKLLEMNKDEVKLIEIGANRSSYLANELILSKQSFYLKKGLSYIIISAFTLSLIVLIKLLF